MANKKLSELDAATSLAGSDVTIVVQGGVTKRVSLNLIPVPDAVATALSGKADASALAAKAPLASPTFTGTPAAPTATAGDNSTAVATTAFVQNAVTTENVTTTDSSVAQAVTGTGVNVFTLTNSPTLTFPALPANGRAKTFTLVLTQDATGARTVTWPANVKWAGGFTPALSTTANKTDVFSFISYDATNWLGFPGGVNF